MVLRFLMLLVFFVFSCADYERDNVYDSKRKNSQYETCGEWNYNPNNSSNVKERRCEKNVIETKCGSSWYDTTNNTWKCQNDVVLKKCGSSWYDTTDANFRCQNNVVEKKCNTGWYDYSKDNSSLRCQNDVIEKKCDIYWNDIDRENDTWRCQNGSLQKMCDTWYNVSTNYCSTDYVSTRYGSLTDSRDYKTYKTVVIDNQTWMAENMNYVTTNSRCYSSGETNCNIYGRLYNWNEANTICPSGWHLPEDYEWEYLAYYIDTEDYGFAPLPGGRYSNGSFSDIYATGFWWSATPGSATNTAYGLEISYGEEGYSTAGNDFNKSSFFSVRCIKNE